MSRASNAPMFIVFEGLDGAGKTTCARALAQAMGARYMTTPPPALRALQDEILDTLGDSQEAHQLFYLATVFAASRRVAAALALGESVVMDRYFLSTQVYAQVRGSRLDLDALGSQLLPATCTIYLDVDVQVRRERLRAREASCADRETLTTSMNAQLRELYIQKSGLPLAGKVVRFRNDRGSVEDVVAKVLHEIGWRRMPPSIGQYAAEKEAS